MGESPEVRGYYLNCAYNSSGMMLSGGCSEQMARWIIDGRPSLDMFAFDIRRFNSRLTGRHQWIKERSHEAYAKNYAIVFPFDEPLACRNQRTDALYQVTPGAGPKTVDSLCIQTDRFYPMLAACFRSDTDGRDQVGSPAKAPRR